MFLGILFAAAFVLYVGTMVVTMWSWAIKDCHRNGTMPVFWLGVLFVAGIIYGLSN